EGTPDELKSELRGDTVQVELLESANGDPNAALSGLSGIGEVTVEGRRVLRARVDNGAAAIPTVISALERSGLRVASATVARPSLDDVYLRHAGRSFQQADNDTKEETAGPPFDTARRSRSVTSARSSASRPGSASPSPNPSSGSSCSEHCSSAPPTSPASAAAPTSSSSPPASS